MSEHSFEIIDNHIITIINGKRVLLDTGAPNSFSDGSSLYLLGISSEISIIFLINICFNLQVGKLILLTRNDKID